MLESIFGFSVPAAVSTDSVTPLHYFDDAPLWRSFILYSLLVFDEVLDADTLRSSLQRLTCRKGWRKLSARLRKNSAGTLEYHFPQIDDLERGTRSALSFSRIDNTHMSIKEHAVASKLPHLQPTDDKRPTVMGDTDSYVSLMRRPDNPPLSLNHYLTSDTPQLGLHIISFSDATLVTLYWPHTLFDAFGKKALLDAWVLMLQGRDDEIPSPYGGDAPGVDFDPLAKLGCQPTEPYKLGSQLMSSLSLGAWAIGNLFEFVGKQETRVVRVPKLFLDKLVNDAASELQDGSSTFDITPFLSEGDVLCAWWTKIATAHLPGDASTRRRTLVLNNAYSLRKALDSNRMDAPYLSNAVGFINVVGTMADVFDKPVGYLASRIRTAIKELGTTPQVEAAAALVRSSKMKLPPFFGDSSMHMITYSNWTKTNLFSIDFSTLSKRKAWATKDVVEGRCTSKTIKRASGYPMPS
ncbi:lysR family regulatory protein [Colletotrichum kahawae]|uniref:LysR family regulatory protein n=1 Tax=Colletotrichum kahawae TaxID=34407 RepID=A0AAD9XXP1_COLKA|nr:lysR family regulatory protein [Colletotrichum kahawae]